MLLGRESPHFLTVDDLGKYKNRRKVLEQLKLDRQVLLRVLSKVVDQFDTL